jgi:hypothetical protein
MTEREAKQDLAVLHYPGKWKAAQRSVDGNHDSQTRRSWPYWKRVRQLYLELGGEYVGQLQILQRLRYAEPMDTACLA